MNHGTKLFRVFGIDIVLHISWWFIFIFLVWNLATGFFPEMFSGYSESMYWVMGFVAAIMLFVSVLLHELSHSFVARWMKIKVSSITLFFFGGVANIDDEGMKPLDEFLMAIAGPVFSLLFALLFYILNVYVVWGMFNPITYYIYQLNFILAIFNLIPAFPLDGGRVFRSILYGLTKDLKKSTRIASFTGKVFAIFFMFSGVVGLWGGIGDGLWLIFLGGFLYFIAGVSYEQVALKESLSRFFVKDLIIKDLSQINAGMKFNDFLKKYVLTGKEVFYVYDKNFSGILDVKRIENLPLNMQGILSVRQLSVSLDNIKGLTLQDNAYTAFKLFAQQDMEVLPVMDKGKIKGFISRNLVLSCLMWELKFGISKMMISKNGTWKVVKRDTKR